MINSTRDTERTMPLNEIPFYIKDQQELVEYLKQYQFTSQSRLAFLLAKEASQEKHHGGKTKLRKEIAFLQGQIDACGYAIELSNAFR